MEYLKIDGEFPRLSGSAVTLGKFDGIHRGHRKLVERILEQKEKGLQTVLFSLGIGSQMIFTKEERCRILEDAGVDVLIECPLDARIRHMKADTFIKEILVGDLQAEHVAVGEASSLSTLFCQNFNFLSYFSIFLLHFFTLLNTRSPLYKTETKNMKKKVSIELD